MSSKIDMIIMIILFIFSRVNFTFRPISRRLTYPSTSKATPLKYISTHYSRSPNHNPEHDPLKSRVVVYRPIQVCISFLFSFSLTTKDF